MTATERRRARQRGPGQRRTGRRRAIRHLAGLLRRAAGDLLILLGLGAALIGLLAYVALLPPTRLAFAVDQPPPQVSLRGFYGPERNDAFAFRWAKPEAVLTVPVNVPADYRLTLALGDSPGVGSPRSVTIRVNGAAARTVQLDRGLREYTVEGHVAPTDRDPDGRLALEVALRTDTFVPPGDPRALGVIVSRISAEPARVPSPWRPAFLLPPLLLLSVAYGAARGAGLRVAVAAVVCGCSLAACMALALQTRAAALALAYRPFAQPLQFLTIVLLLLALPPAVRAWRQRSAPARREVIVALLLLLCYGFFHHVPVANENSQYALVRALVDDHTTRIDLYHENAGDTFRHAGHYYAAGAPGGAFLAVPVYAWLRGAAHLAGDDGRDPAQEVRVLAFAVAGVPTVLLTLLLLRFLRAHLPERWALAAALGYALGTSAFPLATLYTGSAAATCFLFAAFSLSWRVRPAPSPRLPFWAGFLAGWAVVTAWPALLGAAILLGYALSHGRRAALPFAVGMAPAALLLLGYNWLSFGGLAAPDYPGAANGASAPRMMQELLGFRGLLVFAPWLALAPLGLWNGLRHGPRREVAICGAVVGGFLLFAAGRALSSGAGAAGVRPLLPLPALPFAVVLAALVPRRLRLPVGVQIVFSASLFFVVTAVGRNVPVQAGDRFGDFWLFRFLAGELAATTVWRLPVSPEARPFLLLGLAAAAVAIVAIALYATTKSLASARRLANILTVLLAALTLSFGTPLPLGGEDTAAGVAPGTVNGTSVTGVATGTPLCASAADSPAGC